MDRINFKQQVVGFPSSGGPLATNTYCIWGNETPKGVQTFGKPGKAPESTILQSSFKVKVRMQPVCSIIQWCRMCLALQAKILVWQLYFFVHVNGNLELNLFCVCICSLIGSLKWPLLKRRVHALDMIAVYLWEGSSYIIAQRNIRYALTMLMCSFGTKKKSHSYFKL